MPETINQKAQTHEPENPNLRTQQQPLSPINLRTAVPQFANRASLGPADPGLVGRFSDYSELHVVDHLRILLTLRVQSSYAGESDHD